jgi:diguanylate cyclase (GGDEF)-like protein
MTTAILPDAATSRPGDDLDALLAEAFTLTDRTDPRAGLALAERALAMARERADTVRIARALTAASLAHRTLSDYAPAAREAHEAVELLTAAGVAAGRANARVQAANVYFELGDYERALSHLDDARRDLLLVDDPVAAAACAHAEGMVQSRLSEFALARESFERALRLRRRGDDDDAIATTLNSLGVLHLRRAQSGAASEGKSQADFERALAYFTEARDLARRVGDARLELLSDINIAGTLGGQGCFAEALERFLAQIPAARALSDRYNESLLLANAGEACRRLGQHDRARTLCEEALTVAQATSSKVREQQARLQLSLACEATGDVKSALEHYKAHHALERETHAAEARRRAEAQSLRGQIERMEEEAAQLARVRLDLERENRVLERQAREDPLTGLANRRAFDDAFPARLADARAAGRPLAVALFDIDRFKTVNDRFTHAIGDAVLREVAALLGAHCRASDVAARIGGEEFVLLLREADRASALAVAGRVRTEVAARDWSAVAEGLTVTISAGVAADPGTGSAADLLRAADDALYRAKRAGRDRVCG